VEETRVPGENYRSVTSHWQTLSHNVVSSTCDFILKGHLSMTSYRVLLSIYEWHIRKAGAVKNLVLIRLEIIKP
jgi:hypothetical protein